MPRPDVHDLFVFGGLAMLGVGLWLLSPAYALILTGAALAAIGFVGAHR